jgi:hypothetical protein
MHSHQKEFLMSSYYWVPFASASSSSGTIWYATWSTTSPSVSWSQTPPSPPPNGVDSWVACVTAGSPPPGAGVIALGDGGKDLPPPSNAFFPQMNGEGAFREAFEEWLGARHP